jgi:hypothetical protein
MSRDDNQYLGEFEQLVLLAVLQLGSDARALDIRRELDEQAKLLEWEVEDTTPPRGGLPRRRFVVTKAGLAALRTSRQVVANLSRGLERLLEKS